MTRHLAPRIRTVLAALAADPGAWRYGYDLGQQVGLPAGALYPVLMRLCDRGLLQVGWQASPVPGGPARHRYRLTGAGAALAAQVYSTVSATAPRWRLRGAW